MSKLRVVVTDDYPAVRAIVSDMLETQFEVIGTVDDGSPLVETALRFISAYQNSVVRHTPFVRRRRSVLESGD
jgi:CheY-like chemotaxis protein